jgi:hypothetical protein
LARWRALKRTASPPTLCSTSTASSIRPSMTNPMWVFGDWGWIGQ